MCLVFSVVCVISGIWQTYIYHDMTNNCTAEVTGIVVEEIFANKDISSNPIETKYLTGPAPFEKRWLKGYHKITHIDVQTDDLFKTENIYADIGTEDVGDTVIIHYSPDDPDCYYIGDRVNEYKDSDVFFYAISGFMLVLSLFMIWLIRYSSKAAKATENQ